MNCEEARILTVITILTIITIGLFIVVWVEDSFIVALRILGFITLVPVVVLSITLGIHYFYQWLLC